MSVIFRNFHIVIGAVTQCGFSLTEKIRQINSFNDNFFIITLLSRNFCEKIVREREFLQFPHCKKMQILFIKTN